MTISTEQLKTIIRASRYRDGKPKRIEKDAHFSKLLEFELNAKTLHGDFPISEKHISPIHAHSILSTLSNVWGIQALHFYSHEKVFRPGTVFAYGWALSKDSGAIQSPINQTSVPLLIHEYTHVLVDSWSFLRPSEQRFEAPHGPAFQAFLALNLSIIYPKLSYFSIIREMREWGLVPISERIPFQILKEPKEICFKQEA